MPSSLSGLSHYASSASYLFHHHISGSDTSNEDTALTLQFNSPPYNPSLPVSAVLQLFKFLNSNLFIFSVLESIPPFSTSFPQKYTTHCNYPFRNILYLDHVFLSQINELNFLSQDIFLDRSNLDYSFDFSQMVHY